MEWRNVSWTVFIGALFSGLFKQGWALKCFTCIDQSCPYASGIQEQLCTTLLDSCFKFEGVVTQDDVFYQGHTTRGCVAYSVMEQFKPGDIARNACTNITGAKDPMKAETYTGRICVCDTDLCNTAAPAKYWQISLFSVLSSSLLLLFFKLL